MSKNARSLTPQRSLPVGAETAGRLTSFRVWAPAAGSVDVALDLTGKPRHVPLTPAGDGYFEGTTFAPAGTRYRYRLDGSEEYPDPASRFQPQGPHGPSEVIDPSTFTWTDQAWTGPQLDEVIAYEMHVGTFTQEGTWEAAARRLADLADLGVTVIEMLPIGDFPGRFGWGYDGVNFYAPTRLYGTPDDLRAFVDHAHGLGLAVILDVVYNHAGPDGCWLARFSPHYFSDTPTDWGVRSTSTGRAAVRSGSSSRRTPPTGSGVSFRWPAPRCDAADLRSLQPAHHSDGRLHRARGRRPARDLDRRRKRAPGYEADAPRRDRRLWRGCALE